MNKKNPREPEHAQRKLAQLREYPLQTRTYSPTSVDEDERLKAVLRTGCYDPLHVMPPHNKAGLPADTLLDGHRRARLLRELGMDEAQVVVRHDLINAERPVVDMTFYDFALGRRNSQPLDLARMVMDRYEIEKNRPRKKFLSGDYQDTRDRIGKVLGMSGRNFDRYFNVLLCPREIQDAVCEVDRRKRLNLIPAARVAGLKPEQQQDIAARIRAGENPKTVVAAYFAASTGRHKKASAAFMSAVKHLKAVVLDLKGRTDKIYRKDLKDQLPLFDQVAGLLASLKMEAKKPYADAAALAGMAQKMASKGNDEDHFGR
ncbi:MAG: hypothetical protein WCJ35_02365 [Planctomycetota bacterium]